MRARTEVGEAADLHRPGMIVRDQTWPTVYLGRMKTPKVKQGQTRPNRVHGKYLEPCMNSCETLISIRT